MNSTRLLACAALFFTLATVAAAPPATDPSASARDKPASLPTGDKATLRFLQPKVAAGAIDNSAHQAAFEVVVTDAKGKPKAGAKVPLPVVDSGGLGPETGAAARVTARVAWAVETKTDAEGLAVTDAKGIARGVFTSGNRIETVVLRLPVTQSSTATAGIFQVWNEVNKDERWDKDFFENGQGQLIRYTMRFRRAEDTTDEAAWEPITGHKMRMELRGLTISQWNPDATMDEDTVLSEKDTDEATWNRFARLVEFDAVREVEPGVYATAVRIAIPRDEEGEPAFEVHNWSYDIVESNVFGPAGQPGR